MIPKEECNNSKFDNSIVLNIVKLINFLNNTLLNIFAIINISLNHPLISVILSIFIL